MYVAAVCVVPRIISQVFRVPFRFGGTSIMIVVGVALDTVSQIEAHLITRSYEGLTGPGAARDPRAPAAGRLRRRAAMTASSWAPRVRAKGRRPRSSAQQFGHPADLDGRHAPRREEGGHRSSRELPDDHGRRAGSCRTRSSSA